MELLKLSGESLRCWWCARPINETSQQVTITMGKGEYQADVCSEHCSEKVIRAYAHVRKFDWLFLAGTAAFILLMIFGGGGVLSICGLMIGGATLILCPFVTPQTVQLLGLKRSFLIGRLAGTLLFLGALVLLIALKLI